MDDRTRFLGNRSEDGANQLRIGWQRQELARSGADRRHCRPRIRSYTAGHHWHTDPLGTEGCGQRRHVECRVNQHQLNPLTGTQHPERRGQPVRMDHLGATAHGNLACGGDLTSEVADDQEAHGSGSLLRAVNRKR